MTNSLAELHAAYPTDPDYTHEWQEKLSIDTVSELVQGLQERPDPIGYLDDLREKDYSTGSSIKRAFLRLPSDVLFL